MRSVTSPIAPRRAGPARSWSSRCCRCELDSRFMGLGDVPVPPEYGKADFLRDSYWTQRGKHGVPKERFISYPAVSRDGDGSLLLGWAGWDHREQAQAPRRARRSAAARTGGPPSGPSRCAPCSSKSCRGCTSGTRRSTRSTVPRPATSTTGFSTPSSASCSSAASSSPSGARTAASTTQTGVLGSSLVKRAAGHASLGLPTPADPPRPADCDDLRGLDWPGPLILSGWVTLQSLCSAYSMMRAR